VVNIQRNVYYNAPIVVEDSWPPHGGSM